jgi:hypothetical protein
VKTSTHISILGTTAQTEPPRGELEPETATIRKLIWLYLLLWLFEGGLRRWCLPGLATPLLLARDPVVIAIYALSISRNVFVINGFISFGAVLALLCVFNALLLGHGSLAVALYGVRCDFLHVPLIFIMGRVLRQKDIFTLAKAGVWLAIPYTLLLVAQFYAPQDAFVNRGVGGGSEGAGFSGALDRFRPPGTFSFITGPAELYPLFTACWFVTLLRGNLPLWLMMGSGLAILLAIPVSISRSLFLGVVLVAIAGVGTMIVGRRSSLGMVIKVACVCVFMTLIAGQLPAFRDGMEAFSARWEGSTVEEGGFKTSIVDRVIHDLTDSFTHVNNSGLGTGFSTNVGQKILTADVGFGASESEWGRLLYDNGIVLGTLLVGYRVALTLSILIASLRGWRHGALSGLVLASAGILLLLDGQWGQPTTLGSAVICGGLALAASTLQPEADAQPSGWRAAMMNEYARA